MSPSRRVALVITGAFVFLGAATMLRAQSPDLPAGPEQAKVRTACTECHDSHIILQQRLSGKAWTKEADKMTNSRVVVGPADRLAFIAYLSANFPTDKPLEASERTGS